MSICPGFACTWTRRTCAWATPATDTSSCKLVNSSAIQSWLMHLSKKTASSYFVFIPTLRRWLWSVQTSVTPADPGSWANSGARKWRRSSSNKVIFISVVILHNSRRYVWYKMYYISLCSFRRHWEEAQTWSQPTLWQRDKHSWQHSNRSVAELYIWCIHCSLRCCI